MIDIQDRLGNQITVKELLFDQEGISLRVGDGGSLDVSLTLRGLSSWSTGLIAASATALFIGVSAQLVIASANGQASAAGIGSSIAAATATSDAGATVAADSSGTSSGIAAAAGEATASGVGAATVDSIAASEGSAIADAVAIATREGTAASTATATVAAIGASIFSAAAVADGASTASGVVVTSGQAVATSAGAATGSAVGRSTFSATATAAGIAASDYFVTNVKSSVASTAGAATAAATGRGIATAQALAEGEAVAGGVAIGLALLVATSEGIAEATAVGTNATIPPVNPSIELTSQTAGSGGEPDEINLTFSYTGSDFLDAWAATSTSATPPSEAQMEAGTGGDIVEQVEILDYTGGTIELSGFTDDAVTHFYFLVKERNNGGTSGVEGIALTDIDFTAPTVSTVATNEAGDEITITFAETIIGTNDAANFTMSGHTLSSMAGTGTTRTLAVSPAVANGDVDTVSYSGGNLTDERGNALAAFSGQAVTNNVPSAGPSAPTYEGSVSMGFINTSSSATYTSFFPAAGTYVVPFHVRRSGGSNVILTPSGPNVTAATKLVEAGTSVFHDAEIWLVETDAASNLVMSTDATGSAASGRIYRILADGYTATGHVEGGAGGGTPSLPDSSVTLGSAAEVGDAIVAITYFRDANGTGITWGDDAAGNEVAEEIGTAADRSSVALWVADSATAYTASAAITGSDGVHVWVSAIVALKAA